MVRVIFVAILGAVLGSIVTGGSQIGATIGFFATLALMLYAVVTGRQRLRCPHCRKRVKLGATTCHHCGRTVSTHVA